MRIHHAQIGGVCAGLCGHSGWGGPIGIETTSHLIRSTAGQQRPDIDVHKARVAQRLEAPRQGQLVGFDLQVDGLV